MGRHWELDWIDPLPAHVANRTGKAVFDVGLHTIGSVEGNRVWRCSVDKLPEGEFIGLHSVGTECGWATAPPLPEMSWRSADSSEETFKRIPLNHPEP